MNLCSMTYTLLSRPCSKGSPQRPSALSEPVQLTNSEECQYSASFPFMVLYLFIIIELRSTTNAVIEPHAVDGNLPG